MTSVFPLEFTPYLSERPSAETRIGIRGRNDFFPVVSRGVKVRRRFKAKELVGMDRLSLTLISSSKYVEKLEKFDFLLRKKVI